jgi:acetolactate synthase-1/3 small subunit
MDPKNEPRHTIAVTVDNLPGVLSRVTGLFSGRGFNIESLCVAETMDPGVSRMTIVSTGDEQITEQIIKQLHKLINVITVVDLSEVPHVERDMVLVRVKAEDKSRAEVLRIADIFRCRVVDVSATTYTLEITGNHEKTKAVLDLLKNHGIQEIVRTGTLAIQRSKKTDS